MVIGGITPCSSLCCVCQLLDRDRFETASTCEQTIQGIEWTPTCLWAEVSSKLKTCKVNMETRCECCKQIGSIVTINAQVLADTSGRGNARGRNASLLGNQVNHFL